MLKLSNNKKRFIKQYPKQKQVMYMLQVLALVNILLAEGNVTQLTDHKMNNEMSTYDFPFITRSEWQARKPKLTLPLSTPVPFVIIHHSYTPPACKTEEQCKKAMRTMQDMHMDQNGWWDIGYNFAIGSDGSAYEGRGWNVHGAHTLNFNSHSMGICLIGDWTSKVPPTSQIKTARSLIATGVKLGYIKADYKLVGHKQIVKDTECPGDALYEEIKKWDHYTPYSASVKDFLDVKEVPGREKKIIRGAPASVT